MTLTQVLIWIVKHWQLLFTYLEERDLNSSLNPIFIIIVFTRHTTVIYKSVTLTEVTIRFL